MPTLAFQSCFGPSVATVTSQLDSLKMPVRLVRAIPASPWFRGETLSTAPSARVARRGPPSVAEMCGG